MSVKFLTRKVMRALQQFMAVLADNIQHPDGQTLVPPEPAITPPAQLPAGTLPAPPPMQVVPTQGAPMPLAA